MFEKASITVVIATRNEESNVGKCLDALGGWAARVLVVDSGSTDRTVAIAEGAGAEVVQFRYIGGWPKKRQWAMENCRISTNWILLLDADEIVSEEFKNEVASKIADPAVDGYYVKFRMHFLGESLRFGDTELKKLALFRKGKGRFECRFAAQTNEMSDVEIHEHVISSGKIRPLDSYVVHMNVNSLHRYIEKHNEYSTWEAAVHTAGVETELKPSFLGSQAQRRRWLKKAGLGIPFSPVLYFVYLYVLRLGFRDGRAGFIYAAFKAVQVFHVKAKMRELRVSRVG